MKPYLYITHHMGLKVLLVILKLFTFWFSQWPNEWGGQVTLSLFYSWGNWGLRGEISCPKSQGCKAAEPGSGSKSSDLSQLRWQLCTCRTQTQPGVSLTAYCRRRRYWPLSHGLCLSFLKSSFWHICTRSLGSGSGGKGTTQMYIFHNGSKCHWARCSVNTVIAFLGSSPCTCKWVLSGPCCAKQI